jgi:hypothetical protein
VKNKKPPSKTVLAIILEIDIFRKTFINPIVPFLLAVFTGVALTPLLHKTVNIYLYNPCNIGKVPLPFQLVFNTVSFGGMLALILMWTNLHWAYQEKQILTLPLQTKGQTRPLQL